MEPLTKNPNDPDFFKMDLTVGFYNRVYYYYYHYLFILFIVFNTFYCSF